MRDDRYTHPHRPTSVIWNLPLQPFVFFVPVSCVLSLCVCLPQFEDYVMDICFEVLDNSPAALKNLEMDIGNRSDPVYVGRTITAMVTNSSTFFYHNITISFFSHSNVTNKWSQHTILHIHVSCNNSQLWRSVHDMSSPSSRWTLTVTVVCWPVAGRSRTLMESHRIDGLAACRSSNSGARPG